MAIVNNTVDKERTPVRWPAWLTLALLVLILLAGAAFRLVGINWDDNQHLHPDERFMTMVITSIQPVKLSQYFDAATSTLNPNNVGFGYYVYGTLPLMMTRFVGDSLGMTGYGNVFMVGRYLSTLMDLLTVLLVFLAAIRLFKDERIGLLAAAFAAFSVLPIQLSHYFTVDTFSNFFSFLAIYLAIVVMTSAYPLVRPEGETGDVLKWLRKDWSSAIPYAWFGVALGMAVASKINAGLIAILLPIGGWVWWSRLPAEQKERQAWLIIRNLVIGAVVSLIVFRIFQPYAFMGPGFLGLKINPKWIASLKEAANISSGNVEVPYAWQWAKRPITFALQNMVIWGLGVPLGVLAWSGFLWMGWKILHSEWRRYLLLWGWTGVYFAWQSLNWVRAMRYQLLIYPTLAMIAAWTVFELWQKRPRNEKLNWLPKSAAVTIGSLVLILTALWAYAFVQIYTRPVTRIAASNWIYANVPGAVNLEIANNSLIKQQPMSVEQRLQLTVEQPITITIKPDVDAFLTGFQVGHVVDGNGNAVTKTLVVEVLPGDSGTAPLSAGMLLSEFQAAADDPRGSPQMIKLETPIEVKAGQTYHIRLSMVESGETLNLAGTFALEMYKDSAVRMQYLMDAVSLIQEGKPYLEAFTAQVSGTLNQVLLNRVLDWSGNPAEKTLKVSLLDSAQGGAEIASSTVNGAFLANQDPRGDHAVVSFANPVSITRGGSYFLQIEMVAGDGVIGLSGNRPALESSWDDPLPLGLNGYNPFDYTSGLYRTDLNLEMYWDDTADKVQRLNSMLDQADYIFISSNRQYGSITRVPERYPLTEEYYRALLGCPEGKTVVWCYNVAEPGMFTGRLGFQLVSVFQSDPSLGKLKFNSQFAEEAFTVYDAPKVLIFRKAPYYSHDTVAGILGSVDLSTIIRVTPGGASKSVGTLLLPKDRLDQQRAGGTWSDLFNWDSLINKYPLLTVIFWYLFISLLGWVVYPFTRLAMGGLADRGYPLSRLIGMVLLAWLAWISGSAGITVSRGLLFGVFGLLVTVGIILGVIHRKEMLEELRLRWRHYLWLELLSLVFFVIFLLVRLGNPDLWHPYKGGEKPMDFSYFNAVLKSSTFPPYDPWFAGGYINYYYYGFVLVGMPVKLLGIIPSVAYNLILPTLFSLLGMGAFCGAFNLVSATVHPNEWVGSGKLGFKLGVWISKLGRKKGATQPPEEEKLLEEVAPAQNNHLAWLAGISASSGMILLGNLGSVRMVWHGLMQLAAPGGVIDTSTFFQRISWTFGGLSKYLAGTPLPFPPGDWYWIPSRVYPGYAITEFPLFTFLYADLHAHMMAMVLTVLAIAWTVSVLLRKWRWGDGNAQKHGWMGFVCTMLLGGMTIGALKPTNTWDFPTYLILGGLVVFYTGMRYLKVPERFLPDLSETLRKLILAGGSTLILAGLAFILYQPFSAWYGQAYTAFDYYTGDRSPFWSYMTHWGLFLFILVSWFIQESLDWMAKTPASELKKLKPYEWFIQMLGIFFLAAIIMLIILKVEIGWLALTMAAWALLLILRPGQPEAKRLALFMAGTALTVTLVVELVTLRGDLERMNTVFKFYLQAWVLFAISCGAGLFWLIPAVLKEWKTGWKTAWSLGLILLVGGAAWFPLLAGNDKIYDRMAKDAPHTLDGMTYMLYSTYNDQNATYDLSQDYNAIRWMQENVKGSPVIVEGNTVEYRWGSRFTIYTGLPGVVGWNWHQRQQRAVLAVDWVWPRVNEIQAFYTTTVPADALAFLKKYDVKYIIVGQLEKANYPGDGLNKFEDFNGVYWKSVYREKDIVIYEVIQK